MTGKSIRFGDLIGTGEGGYGSYNRGKADDAEGLKINFSQINIYLGKIFLVLILIVINCAFSGNLEKTLVWNGQEEISLNINEINHTKNLYCVAGGFFNSEEIEGDAVVFLIDQGKVISHIIKTADEFYRSSITQCIIDGTSIYIINKTQTNSSQSLNQSLLFLIKLEYSNNKLTEKVTRELSLGYTSWANKLYKNNNGLAIEGVFQNKQDDSFSFNIQVDSKLDELSKTTNKITLEDSATLWKKWLDYIKLINTNIQVHNEQYFLIKKGE